VPANKKTVAETFMTLNVSKQISFFLLLHAHEKLKEKRKKLHGHEMLLRSAFPRGSDGGARTKNIHETGKKKTEK